jgi:hypothetical protein
MNNFDEGFLRNIANNIPQGDFSPFNKNDLGKTKRYIKGMLGALSDKKSIIVEADYSAYGSGFASYINVKISKKDKSDIIITKDKSSITEEHDGLLIYLSLVAPYWYYGKGVWWNNYENGISNSGGGSFLTPESKKQINLNLWQNEIDFITQLFDTYQIRLLEQKELEKNLWFDVTIKSNLANKQLTVFDCFFHWED